jgi:hypothetical protein
MPPDQEEIAGRLAHKDLLGRACVKDPHGDIYRAAQHGRDWHLSSFSRFILCVEIPASAKTTRSEYLRSGARARRRVASNSPLIRYGIFGVVQAGPTVCPPPARP